MAVFRGKLSPSFALILVLFFIQPLSMRILSLFVVSVSLIVVSCGDSSHDNHESKSEPKTSLDSLYSSIWDAHDVVMPKMGKIRGAQKKAARMLDSLNIDWANRGMAEPAEVKSMKRSLQDLIDQLWAIASGERSLAPEPSPEPEAGASSEPAPDSPPGPTTAPAPKTQGQPPRRAKSAAA
jgi:hypothetical protein